MVKSINPQDLVKVKLSSYGIEILKLQHNKNNANEGWFKLKTDKDGYTHYVLWQLMNKFGQYMEFGSSSPFIGDIVVLEEDLHG